MALGRALLHDIGVDLGGLADHVGAAAVVSALEAFGVFNEDGETEFLPYWRTAGILRYGEESEAKEGFAVAEAGRAARTRVSAFLRPVVDRTQRQAVVRREALLVVVNEAEVPVREQLYIQQPAYLFGGRNRVTLKSSYSQLDFSRIPGDSDWRPDPIVNAMPTKVTREAGGRLFGQAQVTRILQDIGQLMDLESNGFVMVGEATEKFEVYGPLYVPARGMRLLYGSGVPQQGVAGCVLSLKEGRAVPVPLSVPVYIFARFVPVSEGPPSQQRGALVKKLQSAADGTFRCPLSPGPYTVLAEIDGRTYPDIQMPTGPRSAGWPSLRIEGGVWEQCVITDRKVSSAPENKLPPATAPVPGQPWTSPSTGIEFVWIPPGTFRMGSPETEPGREPDETPHRVTLTKGFWLSKYEITQDQWLQITGSNPSHFKGAGGKAPVENVSDQALEKEFMRRMRDIGGREGVRYRLPTEAEWEYACRAGSDGPLYTGAMTVKGAYNSPELDAIAWYGGNSGVTYPDGFDTSRWLERQYEHARSGTHPVGQKAPNAFGLYDMLGNVWEWCYDRYTNYPTEGVTDPVAEWSRQTEGEPRVIRGGAWYRLASGCRSAARHKLRGSYDHYVGVRLACEPR
jgi:formylglycine-generating enzyme required for sulfatase activity